MNKKTMPRNKVLCCWRQTGRKRDISPRRNRDTRINQRHKTVGKHAKIPARANELYQNRASGRAKVEERWGFAVVFGEL